MRIAPVFFLALSTAVLFGCASTATQYSINDIDDQGVNDLRKDPPEPIHGRWLSTDTLQITLLFGVSSSSILPKESLKAEVVGDVVQLHLALENDKSRDPNAPVALCDDMKKLVYVLHGVPHEPYQVHLLMNLYGNDAAWDIKPLLIRD